MVRTKILGLSLLASVFAFAGCSEKTETPAANPEGQAETHSEDSPEHAPHGTGPNGGVVFDLGKYHAEFTVDHPKETVMVLIIGDDEKTPTPIAAEEFTLSIKETKTADGTTVEPMTITLKPEDATDGKASKFVGSDPGIGNVADFEGTVVGEIDGKPSQGEFKE